MNVVRVGRIARTLGLALRCSYGLVAAVGVLCACSAPAPERAAPVDSPLVHTVLPQDVQHRTNIDFEGKVQLVGYDLLPPAARPGTEVKLRLYWRSEQRLGSSWRLFTHLTDRGQLLTNLDKNGALRNDPALEPSRWQPGHIYVDEQTFTLPAAADVTILVGLWNELPVEAASGDVASAADADDEELQNSPRLTEYGERRPKDTGAGRRAAVGLRLQVISGPSDGENRAVVAHLKPRNSSDALP